MSPAVVASGVTQRYGSRRVLDRLDLTVGGGVTMLLGPNGSGKTTLLHTLVGLRRPVTGSLSILGADVLRRDGRRAVAAQQGFLPQVVGFHPAFTVQESLMYSAWLKQAPKRELVSLTERALRLVDLTDRAGAKMRTLSGGMIRRVGIAQAIVHRPRLVVLDEPAAGLDPAQRIDLRRTLRGLATDATVLVSTHAVEDVRHIADTVLVMCDGRIVFTGTPSDLARLAAEEVDADTELERGYLTALHGGTGRSRR